MVFKGTDFRHFLKIIVFILILSQDLTLPDVYGKLGGHDLFTSLAQLRELWKNELTIIKSMEESIELMDNITSMFKRYIANHERYSFNQEPNYEFLGHPINAYLLIRHIAMGWLRIQNDVFSKHARIKKIFETDFVNRSDEKLPDMRDIQGAAYGISRLHSLYEFNKTRFFHEGIIETSVNNEKVVSNKSTGLLSGWDISLMAVESGAYHLHNTATDFFLFANKILLEEEMGQTSSPELFGTAFIMNSNISSNLAKTSIRMHDETLMRHGPRGVVHKCHDLPLNVSLRKKFKKVFVNLEHQFTDRYDNKLLWNKALNTHKVNQQTLLQNENKLVIQEELLCKGRSWKTPEETKHLNCFYGHSASPWLMLGPIKVEELNHNPDLVLIHQFLFTDECDDITKFLGPKLGFPPGRMKRKGSLSNDWTMKNCWPTEVDHKGLRMLTIRIEHLTKLKASSHLEQADKFMCGNYGIGGHYGTHPDFHPYNEETFTKTNSSINRIMTVMTVLESPIAGGATVWPYLGVTAFVKKGSSLMWYNTLDDAVPDEVTRHKACPVLLGNKWIGNKWVRYAPQWNIKKCSLNRFSRLDGPRIKNKALFPFERSRLLF